ncbi:MAG: phosphodiester glycosidase family protein [Muribaculaceae bacterium]
MRKIFTICLALIASSTSIMASIVFDGKEYQVDTISQREIGPGIVHTRFRIPDYPLNVNTIEMDLNNPYNRIETNQPYETIGKQETLANAYIRHSLEGKHPIAGANANFWCVPGHGAGWAFMLGTNFGANVCNGKIMTETNCHNMQWSGGPGYACGVAIDTAKKLWVEHQSWYGEAKCSKWNQALEIVQFNKMCADGQLGVFTSNYGKDRQMLTPESSDNIFLKVDDGQVWAVNKDMTATVQAISLNKGKDVVGDYDFCLTGSGDKKPYLQQLQVGDKITINHAWTVMNTGEKPNVDNMVEGNAMVMDKGELTELNYTDGYCAQVYSRCAYGSSADGKKLYIITIDRSTSEYGQSAGCPTNIMCYILQKAGCSNVCNMDAGGSAQMMINGAVVNRTTEGTPRAVSTSWLLYSTAPRSNEVARIAFDQYDISMPVHSSLKPKMLGYNQYGDLIDEDFKGFTLSCDPAIGTTEGEILTAGATPSKGTVTASYNGYSVTKSVKTISADMNIRIKPTIIIDGAREYPIEVTSKIGRDTYFYNPSHLGWAVDDPSIVAINNGVMKANKEGNTIIRCSLNEFTDETNVKVEIADKPILPQAWTGWTLKASGAKELVLTEGGVLNMNYTGGRGQNIKMTKDVSFYSLPDKIMLDFTSSIPLEYVQIDFRSATMAAANYIAFGKELEGGYLAGKRYQIELKISELGDPKDMQLYPISLKGITFYPPSVGVTKGANAITIHGLTSEYTNYSGVESITGEAGTSIKVYPNPVVDGTLNISTVADKADVNIYTLSGTLVHKATVTVNGGSTSIDVTALSPGIYFVKVDTATDNKIQKIIIK